MNSVQNPTSEQNITRVHPWCALGMSVAMAFVAAAVVRADVPPDIAAQLKEIGRVVNPAATAKLYRPLQPKAPYPGVTVVRDVSFGPDPKNVLDVFTAEKGGSSRPVLIYVPGGAGNKIEPVPDGDAFFDNIMLWAVKNGMTGVNMQRRGGQGLEWNDPAKDVGSVVQWVRQHIATYRGNPNRVFIWAHSAGNGPVGTYIGHSELYGPSGVGLKGAVLMSGEFSILPVTVPTPPGRGGPGGPAGPQATGGQEAPGRGRGRGAAPPVDPATQLARSNLPGLLKVNMAFLLAASELDLPGRAEFNDVVKEQLCKARRCPTVVVFKDHSHMSEVFSPNTADDSVTRPVLKWMNSVK